jgi:hypothetical protein
MRSWGRVWDVNNNPTWVQVNTDAAGNNDLIYITTLCQVLRLQPGESPFYANYGIASLAAVQQIIPPDFYMTRTSQQFSQYFASLIISRAPGTQTSAHRMLAPTYRVNIVTHSGAIIPPITVPTSIPDAYAPRFGATAPPQSASSVQPFTTDQSSLDSPDALS